jgi:nucleotidyltransferase substrate binding protein (TIGR01987 family)
METNNIRWTQRFANYKKALLQLEEAVTLARKRSLSQLEKQGLIQGFEYTYELGWNTLKDFLQHQGNQNIYGSRDAIREAFKIGLITDGEAWMDMFQNRNKTSHTYNRQTADEISNAIENTYFELFKKLERHFDNVISR